jgi:hypothetical protein
MEGPRRMFIATLYLSTCLLAVPVPQADDSVRSERDRWQGVWHIDELEITTGKRSSRLKFAETDEASWNVNDNALELVGLMYPFTKAQLAFYPGKDSKDIKLTIADGDKIGTSLEGTYTRNDDRIDLEFSCWPKDKDETIKLLFRLRKTSK